MKRIKIIICVLMVLTIAGCKNTGHTGAKEIQSSILIGDNSVNDSENMSNIVEVMDVENENRRIIAKALWRLKNSDTVNNIISFLPVINAGRLQSAKAGKSNGEKYLDIVAEDGSNFHILLSKSGSVEGIKNSDSGEWVVTSYQ